MNRLLLLAGLGLGILASPLFAERVVATPNPLKVGVLDLESTLYTTPAGKRASERFDKSRKGKQTTFDNQQKALQKAAQDLAKQEAMLKPDVFQTKKSELEKQFVALQQSAVKLERELAEERTKLLQEVLKIAEPHVMAIAKQEGVMLIVDASAVVWADQTIDLTEKLAVKMK